MEWEIKKEGEKTILFKEVSQETFSKIPLGKVVYPADGLEIKKTDDGVSFDYSNVDTRKEYIKQILILETKKEVNPVELLIEMLVSDLEYRLSWKDNIAMAYKDTEYWYKKKNKIKRPLNKVDKHIVANEAAKHFIDLLTKTNKVK